MTNGKRYPLTEVRSLFFLVTSFALLGAGCLYVPPKTPGPVACSMEAKLCPDGSAVGRTGPNCEFAPCPPSPEPTPAPTYGDCSGPGDTSCPSGEVCFQDCGPPVVRMDEPPPGYHCVPEEVARKPRMCPICLASSDTISTPDGPVKVTDIRVGMPVWSLDRVGQRVASRVLSVTRTPVPTSHRVTRLILSDGRQTFASPNHPTSDGRLVGDLRAGDHYDGATVRTADLVPYRDDATYDLLPDSDTGTYWADGIPLGSTLK
jgi:hypothetical protein